MLPVTVLAALSGIMTRKGYHLGKKRRMHMDNSVLMTIGLTVSAMVGMAVLLVKSMKKQ
jgi:Na+-driven multidrug efflux pump